MAAGGLLATAGKSVLVVEAHDRPGGYTHGFRRKRYYFDSGVHLTSGCAPSGYRGGQVIYRILQSMGVLDQVEFVRVDPYTHAVYPGLDFCFPQRAKQLIRSLAERFPHQKSALEAFVQVCLRLCEEIAVADETIARCDPSGAREHLPMLTEYRRATLAEVFDRYFTDTSLRALLATHWPYVGLPPSRVSFVYWSTMFIGYLVDGAFYCRGGFQQLAEAMARGVEAHGGKVRFRRAVQSIPVEDRAVRGVVLDNGEQIEAPVVVSNADLKHTVRDLVGEQHFPERFLQRLRSMTPSLSIFVVYLATDLDLSRMNPAHESFFFEDEDHDLNFERTRRGEICWLSITIPSLVDDSIAPAGQHILMLTTLVPFAIDEPWKDAKPRYTQKLLEMADARIPGLRERILFVEAGSPQTMHRYTRNHEGAAYGWEPSPQQVGPFCVQNRSPLQGLYFAGHWSVPGGGVYAVAVSGMNVAQQVLGLTGQDELWSWLAQTPGCVIDTV